jgi:hypothetical protein
MKSGLFGFDKMFHILTPGSYRILNSHSTLRCTVSPHGPLRVAYPILGSPWASCPHLVLTRSPQFASILFVPIPPRFRLILSIIQRVPILFQHRARAVNSYSIICFKSMSPFHYFPYITQRLSSASLIVYSVCAPVFKEPHSTLYPTCYNS